ncbi:MAG: alpha-L-fucosidase [Flavobacteriaceae bacterium]
MKYFIKPFALLFLIVSISFSCKEQKKEIVAEVVPVDYLKESDEDFDTRMGWWRDAKFGMFIHWGVYSVPAGIYNGEEVEGIGEWIMEKGEIPVEEYEKFAKKFNPVDFDAKKWAKTMKKAGMKYVIITSKHHDGFALWDSKYSDYDIVDYTPFKRDILKELSAACKEEGIKFGMYHSIMDWHHPQAQGKKYPKYNSLDSTLINPEFPEYIENYMKPQLKELIENYDPEVLWFDGEWIPAYTHEMGLDLYQYLRELKPSILINNRIDKGRQSYQGMNSDDSFIGDFGTPEQEILAGTADVDWESCMTMNDTWGFKKNDHNWKSTEVLISDLVDVAAKGGNYLLNVGPTAEGIIPEPSVERLRKMGEWLKVNGEAIYETEKLEKNYKEGDNIRYIKKKGKNVFYVASFENTEKNIKFNYVKPAKDSEIMLLGYDQPIAYTFSDTDGLSIELPKDAKIALANSSAWVFKIVGEERQ